nr:hypothetical protein GCM10017745_49070 [Saccharothrix mutabilis subsp. capreolus]
MNPPSARARLLLTAAAAVTLAGVAVGYTALRSASGADVVTAR